MDNIFTFRFQVLLLLSSFVMDGTHYAENRWKIDSRRVGDPSTTGIAVLWDYFLDLHTKYMLVVDIFMLIKSLSSSTMDYW